MKWLLGGTFKASISLHIIVFSLFFLVAQIHNLKPEKEFHVFEMISETESSDIAPPPASPANVDATPPEESPHLPATPSELISIEDFRQAHPTKKKRPPPPKKPAPRIRIPDESPLPANAPIPEAALLRSQAMSQYAARLQARLDRFWKRPSSQLRHKAVVVFEVSASGDISQIRFSRSSGDPTFDQSVLEAVRHAARQPEPTPNGRRQTFKMPFQLH